MPVSHTPQNKNGSQHDLFAPNIKRRMAASMTWDAYKIKVKKQSVCSILVQNAAQIA